MRRLRVKRILILSGVFLVCAGLILTCVLLLVQPNAEESDEEILLDEESQFSTQVPEESSSAESEESEESEEEDTQASEEYVMLVSYEIEDFPVIYQLPELPTGCEITALTMALQYYGFSAEKVEMATEYLPTVPARFTYGSDGRRYGGDLVHYFVGDPTTENGYICGAPALVEAANSYLADQGSDLQAVDLTGASPEDLYERVSQGQPVVVLVTIGMADRNETRGWYTSDGTYVEWSTNDHGAVLIGYTEDTVILADPLAGWVEYDREQFESVFLSRGSQCVVLE